MVAIITSTKAPEATPESRILLRTESGGVLTRMNYSSEDGEHGYGVTKAGWTPDSKFFVYSLESSGGHQAWHSRVEFYRRESNKIFSLDEAVNDAITNADFTITAPDRVTVELHGRSEKLSVSLSSLRTNP